MPTFRYKFIVVGALLSIGLLLLTGCDSPSLISTSETPSASSANTSDSHDTSDGALLWQAQLGNFIVEPDFVTWEGIVYITTESIKGDERTNPSPCLCAFDTQTGEKKWVFEHNGTRVSAPVVGGGLVYFSVLRFSIINPEDNSTSYLYALDAKTGKEQWHFEAGSGETAQPLFADGIVYFASLKGRNRITGSDGQDINGAPNIHALHAQTGELLWKEPINADTWTAAVIDNGVLYFVERIRHISAGENTYVRALDLKTHETKWTYMASDAYIERLLVANGFVYFRLRYNNILYALDAEAGTLIWTYTTERPTETDTSVGSCCIFSMSRNQKEVQQDNFSILSSSVYTSYAPPGPGLKTFPALAGDKLLIGIGLRQGADEPSGSFEPMDGYMLALDAKTGKKLWRTSVQPVGWSWSELIVRGEMAYVVAYTSRFHYIGPVSLYALDSRTGSILWKLPLGEGDPPLTLAIEDDVIIAAEFRGNIYALRSPTTAP